MFHIFMANLDKCLGKLGNTLVIRWSSPIVTLSPLTFTLRNVLQIDVYSMCVFMPLLECGTVKHIDQFERNRYIFIYISVF